MKIALSIAGSDSGGGAGVQADLKTFSALGVYGCTAITVITAQNTRKVLEIFEISPKVIEQQILSVTSDMPPDAIKIGMVYSKQIIDVVCRVIGKIKVPIVVDPIITAGTGTKLLQEDALEEFKSKLIPICSLITPNRMEAEKLTNIKIRTKSDGIEAAKKIIDLGAKNVIVKGGHFESSDVADIFQDSNGKSTVITNPRIMIRQTHGSGCNFSSAIVAYLAKGSALMDACKMAKDYVYNAITNAVVVGKGLPVTNPVSTIYCDAARYHVLSDLQQAVQQLIALHDFYKLIPETQTNFVYALPGATETSEVAGVQGRIIRVGDSTKPASCIEFGTSRHVASAVIAYMSTNSAFRSAINIRFSDKLIRVCESLFPTAKYDRKKEPKNIKKKEGSTIYWGILHALAKNSEAEIIYHKGDIGKEPMITVFGRSPVEVIAKIKAILENY